MRTVRVAPQRLERWLSGFEQRHGGASVRPECDGIVLTGVDGALARCHPPFEPLLPAPGEPWLGLVAHAQRPRRFGVLLVRRGGYAAGVFDGDALVRSKVGSRYVQGRTAAGGQSQQRFARRRANQAAALAGDAADVAARVLGPAADLVALTTGGDRRLVADVLADPRLAPLAALPRTDWLSVPDPRLAVLRAAGADARAVRITLTELP